MSGVSASPSVGQWPHRSVNDRDWPVNDHRIATLAAGVNLSLVVSTGSYGAGHRPAQRRRTDDSDCVRIDSYVGRTRHSLCTRANVGGSAAGDSAGP